MLTKTHSKDFHWAFITVFQVLAGENWPTIMFDSVRATNILSSIYFVSWVVLGQFILLNLFLAVLMSNFDQLGAWAVPTQGGFKIDVFMP